MLKGVCTVIKTHDMAVIIPKQMNKVPKHKNVLSEIKSTYYIYCVGRKTQRDKQRH